jgi:hypothetical protein
MKRTIFLLAVVVFFCAAAFADVAINDSGTRFTSGSGVTSLDLTTFTVSAGSNRCLIAVLEIQDVSSGFSGLSMAWDNGGTPQSMTQEIGVTDSGGNSRVEIWKLVAPTTGNLTLHAEWTGSVNARLGAIAFSGADQSTCTDGTHTTTATGASAAPSITVTSATGRATVAAIGGENGLTATTSTQTELWAGAAYAASYQTGSASAAHTWSLDGGTNWAAAGVDIKAAGGGGGARQPCCLLGVF